MILPPPLNVPWLLEVLEENLENAAVPVPEVELPGLTFAVTLELPELTPDDGDPVPKELESNAPDPNRIALNPGLCAPKPGRLE